jgi:hypothetical protein
MVDNYRKNVTKPKKEYWASRLRVVMNTLEDISFKCCDGRKALDRVGLTEPAKWFKEISTLCSRASNEVEAAMRDMFDAIHELTPPPEVPPRTDMAFELCKQTTGHWWVNRGNTILDFQCRRCGAVWHALTLEQQAAEGAIHYEGE